MLDERGEISRFTHFVHDKVKVNFVCIATCNDRDHLNTALKGALGSRFGHQVYVPRPNIAEMRLILGDRVREIGGSLRWVDVCLELMNEFGTDDPREVKSWLDYGSALLNGSAQDDLRAIREREHQDRSANRFVELSDEDVSDQELAQEMARQRDTDYERSLAAFKAQNARRK
jgi:hypothetical protein